MMRRENADLARQKKALREALERRKKRKEEIEHKVLHLPSATEETKSSILREYEQLVEDLDEQRELERKKQLEALRKRVEDCKLALTSQKQVCWYVCMCVSWREGRRR